MSIVDCARAFYRRRWLFVWTVTAFVATAYIYNSMAAPLYEAGARVLIEPTQPQIVTFRPVVAEDQGRNEYYQTQYQLLRSRALARRTLEALDLWQHPEFVGPEPGVRTLLRDGARDVWARAASYWENGRDAGPVPAPASLEEEMPSVSSEVPPARSRQVSRLLSSLTVRPVPNSRLVDIRFRSSDRALAARVANGVAEAYIEHNLESRRRAIQEASAWLTERLGELRQEVEVREGALQQYREQRDAISLEDRQNIVVQKLAELNAALTRARTERIARQALHEELRSIRARGAALDTFPPILANGFIQGLKADLAALQRERAQLAGQLGHLHPEMIRIDTGIATAERRLEAEIVKVEAGIENDYRAALANERGLMAALGEQKQEVLELNQMSIGYGALQRDAASTQQIFKSVLQRVQEADLTGDLQASNIQILDAAEPGGLVWPRARLNLIIALVGGIFVAGGLAAGLEYLNPRIVRPVDIEGTLGVPVLGITPMVARSNGSLDSADADLLPPAFTEALRGIRARILLAPTAGDVRTLAVTSATTGEGKTSVASSLAVCMALGGRRVLLIDADLRRPRVHDLFHEQRSPGLADIITGQAKVSTTVRESRIKGLSILTAGTHRNGSADLLDSERFRQLIRGCSEAFDVTLIDCPPVMAVADAEIIANAAAATLFIVGAGSTHREVAQLALERLTSAQAQVIGVVLNKADFDRRSDYYYPYYRQEDSQYYGAPRPSRSM